MGCLMGLNFLCAPSVVTSDMHAKGRGAGISDAGFWSGVGGWIDVPFGRLRGCVEGFDRVGVYVGEGCGEVEEEVFGAFGSGIRWGWGGLSYLNRG